MKLKKIRPSVRIVRTVGIENGFTDRTNRTVREKHLRIVNKVYQSVDESVCDQVATLKFVDSYGSYGPYEVKIALRIVRTVRFVIMKRIYGS